MRKMPISSIFDLVFCCTYVADVDAEFDEYDTYDVQCRYVVLVRQDVFYSGNTYGWRGCRYVTTPTCRVVYSIFDTSP